MAELTDGGTDVRRTPVPRRSRWRRLGRGLFVTVVALVGGWLGLLVGGRTDADVGPLEVRLTMTPALTGDTILDIPPLGTITVDSHDGPLRLKATVRGINVVDAREIFDDPRVLEGLEGRIIADLRRAVTVLVVRGVAVGTFGALALGLLALRPRRRGVIAGGIALTLMIGSTGAAAVTVDRASILEPRYSGLIASAPALIGDAQTIAANFEDYREGLVSMVARVSRLYDVTSTLPVYAAGDDVIRVLHVSDLHVNPTSWPVISSVVDQFEVDVVVDTGDIVHQGTAIENSYVDQISTVDAPYVFVRGNHDSAITERAVAAEPNAIVLDGDTTEVAGLTFAGVGDPRFTPDKTAADLADEGVRAAADVAAETLIESGEEIDVALMHHPVGASGARRRGAGDSVRPYARAGPGGAAGWVVAVSAGIDRCGGDQRPPQRGADTDHAHGLLLRQPYEGARGLGRHHPRWARPHLRRDRAAPRRALRRRRGRSAVDEADDVQPVRAPDPMSSRVVGPGPSTIRPRTN